VMFGRSWEPGQTTIVALKEVRTFGYDANTKNKLQGSGTSLTSSRTVHPMRFEQSWTIRSTRLTGARQASAMPSQ
jgi:hypothetical protein